MVKRIANRVRQDLPILFWIKIAEMPVPMGVIGQAIDELECR